MGGGQLGEDRSGYVRKLKKIKCVICGFVAIDPCQLDIDHIDGDHGNNDILNLQVLCANCHRLKTKLRGDNKRDNRWTNARKQGSRRPR